MPAAQSRPERGLDCISKAPGALRAGAKCILSTTQRLSTPADQPPPGTSSKTPSNSTADSNCGRCSPSGGYFPQCWCFARIPNHGHHGLLSEEDSPAACKPPLSSIWSPLATRRLRGSPWRLRSVTRFLKDREPQHPRHTASEHFSLPGNQANPRHTTPKAKSPQTATHKRTSASAAASSLTPPQQRLEHSGCCYAVYGYESMSPVESAHKSRS